MYVETRKGGGMVQCKECARTQETEGKFSQEHPGQSNIDKTGREPVPYREEVDKVNNDDYYDN